MKHIPGSPFSPTGHTACSQGSREEHELETATANVDDMWGDLTHEKVMTHFVWRSDLFVSFNIKRVKIL